jgi:hypothetical protein
VHTSAERHSGNGQQAARHNVQAKSPSLVPKNKRHSILEFRRTLLIQCDDLPVRVHDAQITFS